MKAFAAELNAGQDWADLMSDQAMIAGAGPGAYSADAFAPTVTYELVPTPGIDTINMYYAQELAGGGSTIEGLMAKALLEEGLSASQFINRMTTIWNTGSSDDATDEQKADYEQLRAVIAPYIYEDAGVETVSWPRIAERLEPLERTTSPTPGPVRAARSSDPTA